MDVDEAFQASLLGVEPTRMVVIELDGAVQAVLKESRAVGEEEIRVQIQEWSMTFLAST